MRPITAFLTTENKKKLKLIVKAKSNLTVVRYVTMLLEKHIQENDIEPKKEGAEPDKPDRMPL